MQLLAGIHLTAMAEVLALASKVGVEAQPIYDLLAESTGLSNPDYS
jgi:3-hydroxyisobutyrate dehydrogenase-like beta-hydroxyacid dehydrogenase